MNKWQTFFTHPMRPFFVAAAIMAMLGASGFLWRADAVLWHRHVFLELMPAAAYGGFLMAAMLEWTNYRGSLHLITRVLGGIWLLAAASLPFSVQVMAMSVAVYWLVLWLFCAYLIWRDRNTDNFALLLLLALFTGVQAAFAYTQDITWLRTLVHINMAAVVFVSFRVSILLGNEALKYSSLHDPVFIPNVVYKNIAITWILLYAFAERRLPAPTLGFLACAFGLILLAKLRELHHHELLRKHYVRTYYAIQLLCAVGYLWLGYAHWLGEWGGTPLHLITIAGILGAMMMVYLTAGLWHSGFTRLDYPKYCRVAMWLLFAAAIARAFLLPHGAWFYITLPALLLVAVFALYLRTFMPIFYRNPFTDDPE